LTLRASVPKVPTGPAVWFIARKSPISEASRHDCAAVLKVRIHPLLRRVNKLSVLLKMTLVDGAADGAAAYELPFITLPAGGRLGWGADIRTELLRRLISSSRQFVEQRLCLSKIGRVEAFGEPAVDRREKVAGFGVAALVAAEPDEPGRGA